MSDPINVNAIAPLALASFSWFAASGMAYASRSITGNSPVNIIERDGLYVMSLIPFVAGFGFLLILIFMVLIPGLPVLP